MKKILSCLTYEKGEDVKPHVLYLTGSKIKVSGNVDFTIFGECRMNGVKLVDISMKVLLCKDTEFIPGKDGGIIFNQAPKTIRVMDEHVPVPEVPDMVDAQTAQLHMLFNEWAKGKGLIEPENVDMDSVDFEFDEESDEDEYDMSFPIDKESLEETTHADIIPLSTREATISDGDIDGEMVKTENDGNEEETPDPIQNEAR